MTDATPDRVPATDGYIRACNGCGRELGRINSAEWCAYWLGVPMPDVRGECGCTRR